jgi:hypothetical protein
MNETTEIKSAASILNGPLNSFIDAVASLSPEHLTQRRKEAEEFHRRKNEGWIMGILSDSRAPKRQLYHSNLDRNGEWAIAEKRITGKLGSGCLIALVGNRGCGKTQLAVEAIRFCANKGKRARYCTATEFFMEVKATYGNESRSEKNVLDEFSRPLLLVIDEVGQRSESEWENRLLFELLNRRYNALKDTLLISNQTSDEFSKSMGPSLVSRMVETGGLIECRWPTYRK